MKFMKSLLLSVCLLSTSVSANLIQNGSFESLTDQANLAQNIENGNLDVANMTDLTESGDWGLFATVSQWTTLNTNGVELQYSGTVVAAQDGNIYMEMDTNPFFGNSNATILQKIAGLTIGNEYELSFWTQARTHKLGHSNLEVTWFAGSESFDDNLGVKKLIEQDDAFKGESTWYQKTFTFEATEETMNIAFSGMGEESGKGALLDNISLVSVPEPSVILLMLTALLGFSVRKKVS